MGASAPLGAGFSARASLTLLDATNGSGQQLDKRPKRTGSVRLDWQEGPWRASLYADYTGTQLLPSATTGAPSVVAPAYTMVGAQVARSLAHGLEASLGVSNLTDVYLFEKSPLFPQAEMPRTWRLAVRGRW
jgi:outer membrane receptor for ferrienterochelin and colicins